MFTFGKSSRLLKSYQFRFVTKSGQIRSGRFIKIQMRTDSYSERRLGITVSRRYGNAVARNRFKRLIREAFRLSQHSLPKHVQINIFPGPEASKGTFEQFSDELYQLLALSRETRLSTDVVE